METAAYLCSHVFHDTHPVLFVSRADGEWQFLCGGGHPADELPFVVGENHLFERDPTLLEIADLPDDWEAERESVGAAWRRTQVA